MSDLTDLATYHHNKYKVFEVLNNKKEVLFKISGRGDELPYAPMKRMLIGSELRRYIKKAEQTVSYVRVL
tara:strand:- start:1514 stop:1723 length:210 start_codon:yes stop_codon:yes gene_type:complete